MYPDTANYTEENPAAMLGQGACLARKAEGNDMLSNLQKLLDSYIEMGIPGYDATVYQGGRCIWRRQEGYADLERRIPMRGNERFNLYSCSKPVTVTAAMLLYEKGLFALDDPLSEYLPEFAEMTVKTEEGVRPVKTPITLRHLFSMQAGFNYDVHTPALERARQDTSGQCPTRAAIGYLAQQPLDFEPGTQYGYSLAHDVLAAVVEVISGEKYEDYVKRVIFEPLGMKNSSFLLSASERERLAPQYHFDPVSKRAVDCGRGNPYILGAQYASGGAGLASTAEDYMRFLEALRTDALFARPETLKLMTTDQLSDSSRKTYGFRAHHGYGLGVRCPYPGLKATDFGWDGTAGAFAAVDRSRDISFFYVQHLLDSPHFASRFDALDALYRDLDA